MDEMSRAKQEPRAIVRFNGDNSEVSSPLPYSRALRVAGRGVHPEFGRFAGGHAELMIDGEVIETVMYLEEETKK